MSNIITFGVSMDKSIIASIDSLMQKTDSKSRSEFITDAVLYYISTLNTQDVLKVLSPAVESSIRGALHDSESHITSMLFKLAVEIDILSHINAAANDIDLGTLNRVRAMCVDEVKSTRGKINFDDAAKLQSRNKK